MPYATESDLYAKYGVEHVAKITNSAPGSETPDQDKVDSAIAQAEAEIDAQLGSCYVVPIAEPPAILKFKAIDMAYFHLYVGCEASEAAKENYGRCLEWLRSLCCDPCFIDIGLERKSSSDSFRVIAQERIFTRDNLNDYVTPSSLGSGLSPYVY